MSVRDTGSASLLKQWKVKHHLAPDPVWALAGLPLEQAIDLPQPRIAVNLRSHYTLQPQRPVSVLALRMDLPLAPETALI